MPSLAYGLQLFLKAYNWLFIYVSWFFPWTWTKYSFATEVGLWFHRSNETDPALLWLRSYSLRLKVFIFILRISLTSNGFLKSLVYSLFSFFNVLQNDTLFEGQLLLLKMNWFELIWCEKRYGTKLIFNYQRYAVVFFTSYMNPSVSVIVFFCFLFLSGLALFVWLFDFFVVSMCSIRETSIRRRRDQISDHRLGVLIEIAAESSGQSRITKRGKLPIDDVRWPQILTCVDNDLRLLTAQQLNPTPQSNATHSTTNHL